MSCKTCYEARKRGQKQTTTQESPKGKTRAGTAEQGVRSPLSRWLSVVEIARERFPYVLVEVGSSDTVARITGVRAGPVPENRETGKRYWGGQRVSA